MRLEGIHHITAITADAPRNVDFYARVLGLRLVKKTVNQDDPTVYHLFYADELGSPGSDITFFEYPGLPRGRARQGHGLCVDGFSRRFSNWPDLGRYSDRHDWMAVDFLSESAGRHMGRLSGMDTTRRKQRRRQGDFR